MRLTLDERKAISEAARATFPPRSTVSLFGSRIDDDACGDDIDPFFETPIADGSGRLGGAPHRHMLAGHAPDRFEVM